MNAGAAAARGTALLFLHADTQLPDGAIDAVERGLAMEDIELCRRLRPHGHPARVRLRVTTSGRRWDTYGVWTTILLMWRLRLLYWLGTPADALAARYR